MAIKTILRQPIGMSERGRRSNNEDSIYPLQAQPTDNLFLVCDGVGGAAKGNIASRLVCDTIGDIFKNIKISDQHFIETCLWEVEEVMEQYTSANPESLGMATTLTLLHWHENGVTAAHVGDSRIYQIRNGQIIYRSEDHSFVQDLVRSGIITPEEALRHPRRNVITRALQGKQRPTKADVYVLQDIKADDYFFLCSDGILESVSDTTLTRILSDSSSVEQKLAEIKTLCEAQSRDNFSCYIIQVEQSTGTIEFTTEQPPRHINTATPPVVQVPPQYQDQNYKPDSVTVITLPKTSKGAESEALNDYKSDYVTVIRPPQASPVDVPENKAKIDNEPKRSSNLGINLPIILIILAIALIAFLIWQVWVDANAQ